MLIGRDFFFPRSLAHFLQHHHHHSPSPSTVTPSASKPTHAQPPHPVPTCLPYPLGGIDCRDHPSPPSRSDPTQFNCPSQLGPGPRTAVSTPSRTIPAPPPAKTAYRPFSNPFRHQQKQTNYHDPTPTFLVPPSTLPSSASIPNIHILPPKVKIASIFYNPRPSIGHNSSLSSAGLVSRY